MCVLAIAIKFKWKIPGTKEDTQSSMLSVLSTSKKNELCQVNEIMVVFMRNKLSPWNHLWNYYRDMLPLNLLILHAYWGFQSLCNYAKMLPRFHITIRVIIYHAFLYFVVSTSKKAGREREKDKEHTLIIYILGIQINSLWNSQLIYNSALWFHITIHIIIYYVLLYFVISASKREREKVHFYDLYIKYSQLMYNSAL